MPSGCIAASIPRHPVQKPAVLRSTQAWPPPVLDMARELHPICNIHLGLLVPLALKLFSSSAASSNTQKSGPARSPFSFPSPHLFPPPISHLFFFFLNSLLLKPPPPRLPCTPTAALAYPICPCVYSACVCMCVCFLCVCQTAPATTAPATTAPERVRLDVSSFAHQLPVCCQPVCTEQLKESWRCSEPGARDTGDGSTPTAAQARQPQHCCQPASHPSSSSSSSSSEQQDRPGPLLHIGTLLSA